MARKTRGREPITEDRARPQGHRKQEASYSGRGALDAVHPVGLLSCYHPVTVVPSHSDISQTRVLIGMMEALLSHCRWVWVKQVSDFTVSYWAPDHHIWA